MRFRRRFATSLWLALMLGVTVSAAVSVQAAKPVVKKPAGKNRDLVLLDYERWVDTLKGNVKNFSKTSARDVTVVVKFLNRKRTVLGTQRVTVGDLRPGDQSSWSLAIEERNRSASNYEFTVHAVWR